MHPRLHSIPTGVPGAVRMAPHVGFRDSRSRRQISYYITHAIDTAERNKRNRGRWNDHVASLWYEQRPQPLARDVAVAQTALREHVTETPR